VARIGGEPRNFYIECKCQLFGGEDNYPPSEIKIQNLPNVSVNINAIETKRCLFKSELKIDFSGLIGHSFDPISVNFNDANNHR
jgi:hypothetical protein